MVHRTILKLRQRATLLTYQCNLNVLESLENKAFHVAAICWSAIMIANRPEVRRLP